MKFRTKKDIVIPAGTEFHDAPVKTVRHTEHIETVLALGPDNTISVVVPLEDDEHFDEMFEQVL